jgi:S-adenosylmethionine hydrolase
VSRVITLLTDYGLRDSYVAEVKAVLVARAPAATVVDVTHEVPAGDVRAGQYLLARVWHRFPAGSVHLAIVDPGVGTSRRALAAGAAGHLFVAPDNGLLSFLPEDARWVELPVPATAAPTFHGRDVFAPAAARLVNDEHLERLGPTATDVNRFPLPAPRFDGVAWVGEVVYIDRFGTLVTNLPGDAVTSARCDAPSETSSPGTWSPSWEAVARSRWPRATAAPCGCSAPAWGRWCGRRGKRTGSGEPCRPA